MLSLIGKKLCQAATGYVVKLKKSNLAYSSRLLSTVHIEHSCVSMPGVGFVVSFDRQNLHTATEVCVLCVIVAKLPESREDVLPLSLGEHIEAGEE